MELKVRKIGNGYGVLLPKELLAELNLGEGSVLHAEKIDGMYQISPYDPEFLRAIAVFRRTEREHQNSYRALAQL